MRSSAWIIIQKRTHLSCPPPFSPFFLLPLTRPNNPHCYPHAVIIVTNYCRDDRKAPYLGHLDGTGTEFVAIYYWTIRACVSILHDELTVYGASSNYTTLLMTAGAINWSRREFNGDENCARLTISGRREIAVPCLWESILGGSGRFYLVLRS